MSCSYALVGCTDQNVEAVKAALAKASPLAGCRVEKRDGAFVVEVASRESGVDTLKALNAALSGLGAYAQPR